MPAAGSEAKLMSFVEDGQLPILTAGDVTWSTEVDTRGELTLRGFVRIDGTLRAVVRLESGTPTTQPFTRTMWIDVKAWDGRAMIPAFHLAELKMRLDKGQDTKIAARKRIRNNAFVFNFLPPTNAGYLRFSDWLAIDMTSEEGKRAVLSIEIDDAARAAFVAMDL